MLFGAEAKSGKSYLTLEMAAAIASGRPFLDRSDFPTEQGRVLLIEQEVGAASLQDRVRPLVAEAGKAMYDNFWYVSRIPFLLNDPEGRATLSALIEQVEPNVIILDPIGKCQTWDENSNTDIGRLWAVIEGYQWKYRELGLSFIISHHFSKPPQDPRFARDPLDPNNLRGSSKWTGDPDTVLTLQKIEEHRTPHYWWKMRVRFALMRHSGPPADMILTGNKRDDRRIRFERFVPTDAAPAKTKG